jgi:enediyne biosynthesis protein E5
MKLRHQIFSDPRHYQIASLLLLLTFGLFSFELGIDAEVALVLFCSTLIFQYAATRIYGLPFFEPRSALISALSLCLLLRTPSIFVALLAAFVTIFSKFLCRWKGKHVFNPTNVGIVSVVILTGNAWVSPGQWGAEALLSGFVVFAGFLVIYKAERADTTIAFLLFYLGLVFLRALWLGDPLSIPLNHVTNGALLIFAFFMISDPRSTPNTKLGRVAFSMAVAGTAYIFRYWYYSPNALIYALALCSLLTPVIDMLSRGNPYQWINFDIKKRTIEGASI